MYKRYDKLCPVVLYVHTKENCTNLQARGNTEYIVEAEYKFYTK